MQRPRDCGAFFCKFCGFNGISLVLKNDCNFIVALIINKFYP
jgi:hypothetical protein